MYCKNDKICNICAGETNYKMNNKMVGIWCGNIGTVLLRMGMKKFHISSVSTNQLDPDDMLI